MTSGGLIYQFALIATTVFYLVIVARFITAYKVLPGVRWITFSLAVWPLLVVDEWLKLLALESVAGAVGLFEFVPVLLMTVGYRASGFLTRQLPVLHGKHWSPLVACIVAQLCIFLVPTELKATWFTASPTGQPLDLWPVYLTPLLAGFGVLLFGILIAENVQRYHYYLPYQAADTRPLRIKRLGGVAGFTVGIAFACILLVSAAAFGFFKIDFWQSLYHLLMATICLFLLAVLVTPRDTSPCPLDYVRLDECAAPQALMRETLAKAEQAIIHTKTYKQKGQRLSLFCQEHDIDPTTLAITLKLSKYKTFRGLIYHYRLEYAKKVLLRSDASIARVAKKLGLESEKFLSGVLPHYLSKF